MPYKKFQIIKNIILSIVLLCGFVINMYYISKQSDIVTHAWSTWYSSSWRYRRQVQIVNPGSAGSYDVLVQLASPYDPTTLYAYSKLQYDCDDFLFTLSDDSATLSFWLESGCDTSNSTTTQIWVRIPSLPSGTSYINMYYGNPSASNTEASWTGNFIQMTASSCSTPWIGTGAFSQRIPYPTTSYGTTGGGTHTHTGAACTTQGQGTSVGMLTGSAGYLANSNHKHSSLSCSVQGPSDTLPPFYALNFCINPDLYILSGMITYFTSTPSGWTRFSSLDGLFPAGAGGGISAGGTGGSATHYHACNGVDEGVANSYTLAADINNFAVDRYHGHTPANVNTGTAVNTPLYRSIIFASKDSAGPAVAGLISMTTATPPLGWTRYSAQDGRYPYGSATVGTLGGNAASHTHTVTITSGWKPNDQEGHSDNDFNGCTAHRHGSCNDTTASANFSPSYIYVYMFERNTSLSTTVQSEEIYNNLPDAPSSLQTEGLTNPQKITDLTPEFSAVFTDTDTSNTGTYYEIAVNTSSSFDGTVMWASGKTSITPISNGSRSSDISYAGTALSADGVVYYWIIRFWDNIGEAGPWSSVANFATSAAPSAPTDLLVDGQTNPDTINSLTPTFSAIHYDANGDSASYYEIEVNSNSSFTGTSMWDTNKSSTTVTNNSRSPDYTYAGTTLTGYSGTTYYWRIRFWDTDDNQGAWSETGTFVDLNTHLFLKGLQLKGLRIN